MSYDNPPAPGRLLAQSEVTPEMAAWAASLLHSLGMFAESVHEFGSKTVIGRKEWHAPERSIPHWHPGVTLYEVPSTIPAPPPRAWVEGIDVSHYQGEIAWDKVKAAGKAFAFVKVSEAMTLDALGQFNVKAADESGLFVGGYHFLRPRVPAIQQATFFQDSMGEGTLPPALDVEVYDGMPAASIRDSIAAWLEVLPETVIYTSPAFVRAGVVPDGVPLWVAEWLVDEPTALGWRFWQYTSKGAVDGIAGPVDLDRYCGLFADLTAIVE